MNGQIYGLLPAAAITAGRVVQRVTSGGLQKIQHATDPLLSAENHVGFALQTITDATTTRPVSVAGPGNMVQACGAAAGLAVGALELVSNGSGQLIAASAPGQQVVALNVLGETLAADAASADAPIRVLACYYIKPNAPA